MTDTPRQTQGKIDRAVLIDRAADLLNALDPVDSDRTPILVADMLDALATTGYTLTPTTDGIARLAYYEHVAEGRSASLQELLDDAGPPDDAVPSPVSGLTADEYAEVAEFMESAGVPAPVPGEYSHDAMARLMLAVVRHFTNPETAP